MMAKKESDEKLRKEFYSFQGKVNKLDEIKHELEVLDSRGLTKGFEKEVSIIKSRLKDTTAIPELDKLMKDLRQKVMNRREVRKKSPLKEIEKDFSKVSDSNIQLKREIKSLKSTLSDRLKQKDRVDSDVDLFVDERFKGFVDEIKKDLTKKVSVEEKQLNNKIRNDSNIRRKELEAHYRELQVKLKQEYKDKTKTELQKEISKKFNDELRKKFEEERDKIDVFYISKLKEKSKQELEKQRKALEENFKSRLNSELRQNKVLQSGLNTEMQNLQIIETNKKEEYAHKFQKLQGLEEKKIQENNRKLKDKLKGLEATKSRIRVQLADEAHKKLTDEIGLHRKKLDNELKRQFALRMNSFVIVQKQKQEREVEQKVKELRDALEKQRKSNDELARRLAEKSQFLEKQKKNNKELIEKQSRIKHEAGLKREEEHRGFVERHKREVRDISEKLKGEFHDRFDAELRKHINEEKLRLENEFDLKKRELMHKSKDISSKEREELKAKLRKDYEIALNKSIEQRKKKLQDRLRSEYGKQVNEKILFEKRKLENKLKDVQSRHDAREAELKIKEKRILEEAKTKAMELASEKKQLLGKLNIFKKEEDVRMSNERIKMQKELTEKAHQHMINEMKSREALIKSKIEKQFEQRLKDVLRHHDLILAKKKEELANELQKKARALLG